MNPKLTRRACLGIAASLPFAAAVRAAPRTIGGIKRFDPALDTLLDANSPIEILSEGHKWTEGPVWVPKLNALLFSDVPKNVMWRWSEGQGSSRFLTPSGLAGEIPQGIREAGSNGLTLDRSGQLVIADTGTRAIARVDLATKAKTILVDRYEGKRLNGCNDVIVTRSGAIYFTDPPYGFSEGDQSLLKELDFNGVFRLSPDGKLAVVDRLTRPNGVALSPDEKTLYIGVSDPDAPQILAYSLDETGIPTGKRVFRDFKEELATKAPGLPDGLKVDRKGNLFASGPGGIFVLSPDGKTLGLIATDKAMSNCAFGAHGWLYATSSDMVVRVKTKTGK